MDCPTCREELDRRELVCPQGHAVPVENGVIRLIRPELAREIDLLSAALKEFRAGREKDRLLPDAYDRLPEGQKSVEWRLRRVDLKLVRKLLEGSDPLSILDVGAWNGWLTNQMAGWGHDVTAVDYFGDEDIGLGARRYYGREWRAIQLDLADLSLLGRRFDLVVLNRCLSFFPDPGGFVPRRMVSPDGILLVTGLQIFSDPSAQIQNIEGQRTDFRRRFGRDLFLRPAKGYLDMKDKRLLEAAGLVLKSYRALWMANLKARFRPAAPRHYFGLAEARLNEDE